jgi:alpha-L-fucosidase
MHWGVPSAVDENRPFNTGWYGAGMYLQNNQGGWSHTKGIYEFHVSRYGHPSKVGYKDLIPLWKAEHWDPDALVAFYKKIGAKYIVPVACHHDNFDCYDSSWQRWNSVQMGPHKDILAGWKKAAEKYDIRFGASTHLEFTPGFFKGAGGSDKTGPLKGVPYDGADPRYRDLYLTGVPRPEFELNWFRRTKEIIDKYQPDLMFFDTGGLDVGDYGLEIAAHFYNSNLQRHGGKEEGVINVKRNFDNRFKAVVSDIERGQTDSIRPYPWQSDTTLVSGWFYHKSPLMITVGVLIGNLVDIVSKNGNLLLNVALKPDGTLPEDQRDVLEQLGIWLQVNGEAIYGTRPWKVFGEGPTQISEGRFKEQNNEYTSQDIRFTTKAGNLYAIVLAWPTNGKVTIKSLGEAARLLDGRIASVEMLGSKEILQWTRLANGLTIKCPDHQPCEHAFVLKISTKGQPSASKS